MGDDGGQIGYVTPAGQSTLLYTGPLIIDGGRLIFGPSGGMWLVDANIIFFRCSIQGAEQSNFRRVVTSASTSGSSNIQSDAAANGASKLSFSPYGSAYTGGLRIATGDFNHDSYADIVTAPGPGMPTIIKIFSGLNGQELRQIQAFRTSFTGGAYVAVGDVNGDGVPDIIVGAGAGMLPRVKVFSGKDGTLLENFLASFVNFTGVVRVAAADINGDGYADIIVGTGPGTVPHVKVFSGKDLNILRNFLAYNASFTGGIFVSAGDVNGDGTPDIITGTGAGVQGHVKVFSGQDNSLLQNYFVFSASFTGGVRVGYMADKQSGGGDILVASGPGKPGKIELLSGTSLNVMQSFSVPSTAGLFVGGG